MQIGSRPAVRPGKEGFDALRSVPWVFSWTQSRHMLPAWFGAGVGLRTAVEELGLDVARSAYAEWNYFTTLIDDLEASLARADLDIAAAYEELGDGRQRHFGVKLREEFKLVAEQVLSIKQTECAARSRPDDAALDRAAQSVRGPDQPAAGRPTKALAANRSPGPRFVRIPARLHRGDCRGATEYWMMAATDGYASRSTQGFGISQLRGVLPVLPERAPPSGVACAALPRHLGFGAVLRQHSSPPASHSGCWACSSAATPLRGSGTSVSSTTSRPRFASRSTAWRAISACGGN